MLSAIAAHLSTGSLTERWKKTDQIPVRLVHIYWQVIALSNRCTLVDRGYQSKEVDSIHWIHLIQSKLDNFIEMIVTFSETFLEIFAYTYAHL